MCEEYINNRIEAIFSAPDSRIDSNCGYILKKFDSIF